MYGQWVMDDMLSLTYIESSRPCSPHFEYISENQNPWEAGSFPQRNWESPYHLQLTPQNGPALGEFLSTPTTCLSVRQRPETNQTKSTYLGRVTNSSFGLRSVMGSSWTPSQDCRKVVAADSTSSTPANSFAVTEPGATHQQAHLPEIRTQRMETYATMATEVDDSSPTSDADADADQQHLDELAAFDEFDHTDFGRHTKPTLNQRSSCATESPRDAEIFMSSSNPYALLDQPFFRVNWTMGFNTRLPLARLDKYLVALRQIVRRCCEATTITNDLRSTLTAEGALWVVKEAWPMAEGFWTMTTCMQGFFYAELWRNFPCRASYTCLPPAYRPTQLQLMVPHSPIIDWLPWPELRDLVIQYQEQIDIDAMCRYAILSMVAHRKKAVKRLAPSSNQRQMGTSTDMADVHVPEVTEVAANVHGHVSFRIWDLALLESSNEGPPALTDSRSLRAKPQPKSQRMKVLQRAYDLEYDDFSTMKIEDRFFERYPFLYQKDLMSDFKVHALSGVPYEDVGMPSDITCDAVFRLKDKLQKIISAWIEL